jgi:uncharacterized protein YhbP (UPF0306 family)
VEYPSQLSDQALCQFLRDEIEGVLATIGPDGAPWTSYVAFSLQEELAIVVGTSTHLTKAGLVRANSTVAFNVTNRESRLTVQLTARAHELTQEQFDSVSKSHYQQLPTSRPFRRLLDQTHFLLRPKYIQFSDCSSRPWKVREISL